MTTNDRKLPGLFRALNDEDMHAVLASALSVNGLTGIQSRVLKHTPGKRCVIEYSLHFANDPATPRRLIGKVYRRDRGNDVFENLCALWRTTVGNAGSAFGFSMPEPLAYLPEIGLVLQSVVPGKPLSDFREQDDLASAVRAVATNLATLHGLMVGRGDKRTLEDHVRKYCHPGPRVLIEACPECAPLVESILSVLAQGEGLLSTTMCPVHGDLGLAQIFIDADRASFIDFDGFCLSHAALDVANFLTALRVHLGSQSAKLSEIFLENYSTQSPAFTLTDLKIYQALIYLRRAMICFRHQAEASWRQNVRQLLEQSEVGLGHNAPHSFSSSSCPSPTSPNTIWNGLSST